MKRFDDRATCFHSGKKISPPMNERRLCACCGLRIVKGFIVEIGHVGEDCAGIIERRSRDRDFHGATVKDFAERYKRATGWTIKPAVLRTLEDHYP
ncbi:hypothetical protein ACR3H8_27615 [Pseudomonas aeruginosa]|jgi:hypothetical protein|uniref:Uncharacterized protein n=5 Tax=Pseudomonas TaxID=286 RepID=A0A223Q473_PSEPU|nr:MULTISPECIES: hypothetical protein [Pseudomonas]AGL46383.1 hypothetical protein pOZ176_425 [Pseudomonas aeruginosa PA96]AJA17231.1 hypothetical protein RPPX_28315 [Pseudomonas putida S12]ASU52405.1 Hypothetical protein [Pseudomonas putida]AVE20599.1 Hypothetical protein [Pseudomonas aeruginosa]AVE21731.1 Hypothetical protein [Pseudomonas aeruginosa]